jgi:hypothetical protein
MGTLGVVNPSPSGSGSAYSSRCAASASAATLGSVTSRRPASVFGGLRMILPATSAACSTIWTRAPARSTWRRRSPTSSAQRIPNAAPARGREPDRLSLGPAASGPRDVRLVLQPGESLDLHKGWGFTMLRMQEPTFDVLGFLNEPGRPASVATVRGRGRPALAMMWFLLEDDRLWFHTAEPLACRPHSSTRHETKQRWR